MVGHIRVVANLRGMHSMETELSWEDKNEVAKIWMRRVAAKTSSVVCDEANVGLLIVHKMRVGREESILSGIVERRSKINDGALYDALFKVIINRHTSNSIKELALARSFTIEVVEDDGGIVPVFIDFERGQECCRKGGIMRSVGRWDRSKKAWGTINVRNLLGLSPETWALSNL